MIDRIARCKPVTHWALAGTVAAALALLSQVASASVVTTDLSGAPLVVPFDLNGVYIDLAAGVASTDYTTVPGFDINALYTGTDGSQPVRFNFYTPNFTGGIVVAGVIPGVPAQQLAIGATVGSGLTYKNGNVNASSANSDIHYIGFRFLNEATSVEDYGYIAIQQSIVPAAEGSVQILGWAYDDSGAAITVNGISAVPEPATSAMFGLGLLVAGTLGARRRRLG